MPQPMMCKPASAGTGPETYAIHLPLWPGTRVHAPELDGIAIWESAIVELARRPVSIERRESYFILHIRGFRTEQTARGFLEKLACSLIQWSIKQRATIRFSPIPEPILTSDDPNRSFRESLREDLYPGWRKREDGTITDGGICPEQTCIIPEHKRIGEYPAFYARSIAPFKLNELTVAIENSFGGNARILEDEPLLLALEVTWTAFDQLDRRVRFILLMTALETLAASELAEETPEYLLQIVEEL
jgi:hypothetical protein